MIQHRQRGVVTENLRCRHHGLKQQRVERLQPPRRALDPVHQRGTVEVNALTRQHLRLAVQWQVPRELRYRDMSQQRGCRQSAFNRTWRRRRLHHGALAGAAAIARPADALDPDDRRHDVEHLADVLTDAVQRAVAARARIDRRLDDDIFARQMFRKTADVTHALRACRLILPFRLGSSLPLRFDRRRREILEPERQLPGIRIEPLRASPNRVRFSVANIARNLSFSSRSSAIIPIRMSGSRGREATSDVMQSDVMQRVYRSILAFR
jgi:hypothetical protein